MGPEGAVNILYKRELDAAEDPEPSEPSEWRSSARSWRIRLSLLAVGSSTR